VELDLAYKGESYEIGGNYTYINVKNKTDESVKRTDVPKHEIFAYVQKDLGYGFSMYGDMKFREGAYESVSNQYVTLPTFTTYDIKAVYKATEQITAEAGIKNVTDKLVIYNYGYPNAGREFFANLSYKF
jgi:iron complex outermembrane receptor protein